MERRALSPFLCAAARVYDDPDSRQRLLRKLVARAAAPDAHPAAPSTPNPNPAPLPAGTPHKQRRAAGLGPAPAPALSPFDADGLEGPGPGSARHADGADAQLLALVAREGGACAGAALVAALEAARAAHAQVCKLCTVPCLCCDGRSEGVPGCVCMASRACCDICSEPTISLAGTLAAWRPGMPHMRTGEACSSQSREPLWISYSCTPRGHASVLQVLNHLCLFNFTHDPTKKALGLGSGLIHQYLL